jgi:hypothetical protein
MANERIRGFYFHHLPREEKYGKKGIKRLNEEGGDQAWRIAKRMSEIQKKGFCEGCKIQIMGKTPIHEVKKISKDGFLILLGSSVRITPGDCVIV